MLLDFNEVQKQIACMIEHGQNPQMVEDFRQVSNIIDAMTPNERHDPDLLLEREPRLRVARTAGVPLDQVDALIAHRQQLATMLERIEAEFGGA